MTRDLLTRIGWMGLVPLAQLGAIAGACALIDVQPVAAAALAVLAGALLAAAIHTCHHEAVHATAAAGAPLWWQLLASVAMGLPFDGYRLHHENHHRHENGPGDYSTTWRHASDATAPRGFLAYSLLWPRQLIAASAAMRAEPEASRARAIDRRIPRQRIAILLAIMALTAIDWRWALVYLGVTYLGWVLTSAHNYGQHPPTSGAATRSVHGRWYNALGFNNGLHAEHHRHPAIPHLALRPETDAAPGLPPLVEGLRRPFGQRPAGRGQRRAATRSVIADALLMLLVVGSAIATSALIAQQPDPAAPRAAGQAATP